MQRLECDECGTKFQCGSNKGKTCWCHNLPNLRTNYDLAGKCVCPDCLTQGKAKQIIRTFSKIKIDTKKNKDIHQNSRKKPKNTSK